MYFLRKSADPNYKLLIMAQEDNLRALGKIIDFIRAVSILFVIIHIYWFCYEMVTEQTLDIEVVDKILMNFTFSAVGAIQNMVGINIFLPYGLPIPYID